LRLCTADYYYYYYYYYYIVYGRGDVTLTATLPPSLLRMLSLSWLPRSS
jgi:hypothetical protein